MAFLEINGWALPVVDGSVRVQPQALNDDTSISVRGATRVPRRAIRESWSFDTCFLDHLDGKTLANLAAGNGHFFDLATGTEAQSGLSAASALGAGARFQPGAFGQFGRGVLAVPAATGRVLEIDTGHRGPWTILCSRKTASDATWYTGALCSDGRGFEAGAPSSTFGRSFGGDAVVFDVHDGVLVVTQQTDAVALDDLVFLPYAAGDGALSVWTSPTRTRKFGPLPFLRVSGDIVGGERLALGKVGRARIVDRPQRDPFGRSGWLNNLFNVELTLMLIDHEYAERALESAFPSMNAIAQPGHSYVAANVDGAFNATLSLPAITDTWVDAGARTAPASALFQAVPANQPVVRPFATSGTGKLGFVPAATFDGVVDDMPIVGPITPEASYMVAAVFGFSPLAANDAYVLSGLSFSLNVNFTTDSRFRVDVGGGLVLLGPPAAVATPGLFNVVVFEAVGTDINYNVNGYAGTVPSGVASPTFSDLRIGGAGSYGGDMVETHVWFAGDDGYPSVDDAYEWLVSRFGLFPQS